MSVDQAAADYQDALDEQDRAGARLDEAFAAKYGLRQRPSELSEADRQILFKRLGDQGRRQATPPPSKP